MTERTDEETVELIREWLQQYGLTIIAGIVLGLSAIGGYQWWQQRETEQRYQQSSELDALRAAISGKQFSNAETLFKTLQDQHDNISELAGLSMAEAYRAQNKPEEALKILQTTATEGKDVLVQQTAWWQAANVAVELGQWDAAEKALASLRDSPYVAQASALQGYIYEQQHKLPEAVQAYKTSLELSPNPITATQLNAVMAQLALQPHE